MSKIRIRKAVHEDANEIANVLLDFYNMDNKDEAKNAFLSELSKDYKYIVATDNGSIVGLVTWLMHGLPKHGLFELDRICVLSKSRGKGLGEILVNGLIEDAKNWYVEHNSKIRKLYLLTHEDNVLAQNFYEKVGFSHESTLKSHYYDKLDEKLYSIFFNE